MVRAAEPSPLHRARALLAQEPALAALADELAVSLGQDAAHDLEHCLRVADWTLALGEGGTDPRECLAAALLHDVVNVPKDHPDRALASERSAALARLRLRQLGFDDDAVARIADAIEDHSYSRGAVPRSALGCALQDADRLEALGALGLMRTISTGATMGAAYFCRGDAFGDARPLEDRRYSVDHFFKKLLLLPARMNTAKGREEAEKRAAFLVAFLRQLADEVGEHQALERALGRLTP